MIQALMPVNHGEAIVVVPLSHSLGMVTALHSIYNHDEHSIVSLDTGIYSQDDEVPRRESDV